DTVVTGKRIRVRAHVRRTLHVVVTAIDVRPAARDADIAERKLKDAGGSHDRIAGGVLGLSHRPDDGARFVLRHRLGDVTHLRFFHAGHALDLVGCPLRSFRAHLVHAEYTRADVLLVFPAVLEDVIEHAVNQGDVRSGADAV